MQALNQIKRELWSFYAVRGWGRKRTEKAVKSDLCAIVRHTARSIRGTAGFARQMLGHHATLHGPLTLQHAEAWFVWHNTPEGHTYWAHRFGYF